LYYGRTYAEQLKVVEISTNFAVRAHPASYPMGTRDSFLGGKVAGA